MKQVALWFTLAGLLLAAGCRKAPAVRIDSPHQGDQLTAASDLDPITAGTQLAVDATIDVPDGTEAWAAAGAAPVRALVVAGKAHWPQVTLPDGDVELRVTAVDLGSQRGGQTSIRLHADSLAHGCRFVEPAPGLVRTDDPGDGQLWSQPVTLLCRGAAPGASASLFVSEGSAPLKAPLDANGQAAFHADLVPGANLLVASVPGLPVVLTTVTVQSDRCPVSLAPASGTLFNQALDRDLAAPGMQARLTVTPGCSAALAKLDVLQGGVRVQSLIAPVQGGAALFDLTLPDGADVAVQAFAGGAGKLGASRVAHYRVDSVVPGVSLDSPAAGAIFGDADDADPAAPGFQVRFAGHVAALGAGGTLALHLDDGAVGGGQDVVLLTAPDTGAFSQLVTLGNGSHTARVVNLVVTPVVAGAAMSAFGAWRRKRGEELLRLDRFAYAMVFAFAMAVVRFVFSR